MPAIDAVLRRLQARATAPDAVATLLNDCDLVAFETRHRLVEVETYLHRPDDADPYAHCDPLQARFGRWYLHRKGGTLKNGTFKGLDLTYGLPEAPIFGGLLIRSLETPAGVIVDGPCKVVDHLIALGGFDHVARLDAVIRHALRLEWASPPRTQPVYRTARVGLGGDRDESVWRARRERFLTEPRRVKKGRRELIDALLADGRSEAEIRSLTNSPLKAIRARTALRD